MGQIRVFLCLFSLTLLSACGGSVSGSNAPVAQGSLPAIPPGIYQGKAEGKDCILTIPSDAKTPTFPARGITLLLTSESKTIRGSLETRWLHVWRIDDKAVVKRLPDGRIQIFNNGFDLTSTKPLTTIPERDEILDILPIQVDTVSPGLYYGQTRYLPALGRNCTLQVVAEDGESLIASSKVKFKVAGSESTGSMSSTKLNVGTLQNQPVEFGEVLRKDGTRTIVISGPDLVDGIGFAIEVKLVARADGTPI